MKPKYLIFFLIFQFIFFSFPYSYAQEKKPAQPKKPASIKKTTQPKKKVPAKEKPKSNRYSFAKLGLSFLPPKGWTQIPQGEKDLAFFVSSQKYPNISVKTLAQFPWIGRISLLKNLGREIELRYGKKFLIKTSQVKLDEAGPLKKVGVLKKMDVIFRGIQTKGKGPSFAIVQTLLFFKKATLIFTFTAREKTFSKNRPLFQKTLDSLKRN